jgi:predicted GIY-YIG superfamily endonuclease
VKATVYLIHFDRPYHHARHYLGSSNDVPSRLEDHKSGRGANIMKVVTDAGIGWSVSRMWLDGGRELERKFKKAQHNSRLCPICNKGLDYHPE